MTEQFKPEAGIYEELPSEVYHRVEGISFTGFKEFMRSPRKYQYYRANPPESTASQRLGQLVHALVLEPEKVSERFALIDGPMNKNPWKQQADEAKAKGLACVGGTDRDKALGMRDAILSHPEASYLIRTGKKEVSFWARHPLGFLWKARTDLWHDEMNCIGDIKYTDDASEEGFLRQVRRMLYHIQSPWYLDVVGAVLQRTLSRHTHICVEEEAPHEVQLHAISDQDLNAGRQIISQKLEQYAQCYASGTWPGLPTGVNTLILPHYFYKLTPEGEVMA